jgi:pimeloyl-ACP methyl ester carboxylesterase
MLIDVGGHRLHLAVFGRGGPTVVFDAGLGDAAGRWETVPGLVADFARVCVYDRAGLGRSEAGPLPRTSGRIVGELRVALARAGVAPPYVLVGHSFGGQNMRLYASRHPADVAGLVLVDASHPDLARRFAAILTPPEWAHFLAGQEGNL